MKALLLLAVLASAACSSGSPKPTAPPPASSKPTPAPAAPAAAATAAVPPAPVSMARTDPNVVEETDTYVITRLPKAEYIKVDDRRIKHPLLGFSVEFFKEDDDYYYVIRQKRLPDEEALKQQGAPKPVDPRKPRQDPPPVPVPLSDFDDLFPARVAGRVKLEAVSQTGLPPGGMWRASFVLADMNGDGRLDIVAPAPRIGDGSPHVWLGDGKGRFAEWPLTFSEDGKPAQLTVAYGGVAAGDIDGDGKMDFACATHGSGVVALFGDGNGGFRIVRKGLPGQDFSAQAVVLLDADGDGKLDIVASRDREKERKEGEQVETAQVRVYLYRGADGWKFKEEGLVGGFYSNSLSAWDYDSDGRKDVLTGSHYVGALTLLWKNVGDGTFSPIPFNAVEIYAYHFATAPGTFGKDRVPGLRGRLSHEHPGTGKREGDRDHDLCARERALDEKPGLARKEREDSAIRACDGRSRRRRARRRSLRGHRPESPPGPLPEGERGVPRDGREGRAHPRFPGPVHSPGGPRRRRSPRCRCLKNGYQHDPQRQGWVERVPEPQVRASVFICLRAIL